MSEGEGGGGGGGGGGGVLEGFTNFSENCFVPRGIIELNS